MSATLAHVLTRVGEGIVYGCAIVFLVGHLVLAIERLRLRRKFHRSLMKGCGR